MRSLITVPFLMRSAIAALALAALGAPAPVMADSNFGIPANLSITVEPSAPSEPDPITITVEGTLPSPCYEGSSRGHTLSGDTISILIERVRVADFCAQILWGFTVAEEIGQLPAGTYQVRASLLECIEFPACLVQDSASGAFQVQSGSVGGIAELPDGDAVPLAAPDSAGASAGAIAGIAAAIAAAAIALGGGALGAGWYARRRWLR